MNLRIRVVANMALLGALTVASAETVNFLSTAPANWVGYAGSPVPQLNTTSPGSIVDATSSGASYGRLNTSFTAYPGLWEIGDTYRFQFNGVVSNNTQLRLEFTDASHAAALQLVVVNGAANNADLVQINALGGTSSLLFSAGNLGGAGGVGVPQQVIADLTLSIVSGTSASLSGTLADSTGTLWSGPGATINLPSAPSAFYAAANLNSGAGVTGITTLSWTLTQVPEPGTFALFAGMGLAGLWFARRQRTN